MLILVDQDCVLADFELGFVEAWNASGKPTPAVPVCDRRHFELEADYPDYPLEEVHAIYRAAGFYRNLKPIAGAVHAMRELLASGHDVRICTAPASTPYCGIEKYEWTVEYFGQAFADRMILTKDKTLVRGQILIDDKPQITGCCDPEWTHVLYTQPYNLEIPGPRLTWTDWREVLERVGGDLSLEAAA